MSALQGSTTIRRLRSGETVYLTLDVTAGQLWQSVDDDGNVSPQWTAASHPVVTPHASTHSNESVTLSDHSWKWRGSDLVFGDKQDDGLRYDTTSNGKGKFAMDPSTGALHVVSNLAGPDNTDDDELTYSCRYTIGTGGVTGTMSKPVTAHIVRGGAVSYMGFATPDRSMLDNNNTSAVINTTLIYGSETYSPPGGKYYCKWYKGTRDTPMNNGASSTTLTVTRDDVDGQTLFICDFYLASSDKFLTTDGCHITDNGDEFGLRFEQSGGVNGEMDDDHPVTTVAEIYNTRTQDAATVTSASWDYALYRITRSAASDGNTSGSDSDFNAVKTASGLTGDSGNPGRLTVVVATSDTEQTTDSAGTVTRLTPSEVELYFGVEFEAEI